MESITGFVPLQMFTSSGSRRSIMFLFTYFALKWIFCRITVSCLFGCHLPSPTQNIVFEKGMFALQSVSVFIVLLTFVWNLMVFPMLVFPSSTHTPWKSYRMHTVALYYLHCNLASVMKNYTAPQTPNIDKSVS